MKRYKLNYFFDEDDTRLITVSWEQGLHNFIIKYNNETFFESKGIGELNKGISIYNEQLGNVFVRLCSRPLGFEVKVGDLYLRNSRILAQEALSSVSAIWIFIGIISTLSTIGFMFLPGLYFDIISITVIGLMLALSIFYIIAGVLIKKGKIWAFYSSLGLFSVMTLLYFITFDYANIPLLIIRIIAMVVVLRHFKSMRELHKHYRAKKNKLAMKQSDSILDNL